MTWLRRVILDGGREQRDGLLHVVYPRICWVCGKLQSSEKPTICEDCANVLQHDPFATCPRCSSSVGPHIELSGGCPKCRDVSLAFDRTFRLGPYDGLLRETVLRMKQQNGEGLNEAISAFWAARMAPKLKPLAPDVVVPIPLHWLSRWRRGFNQSEILAAHLAAALDVPCRDWLRCIRRTGAQKALRTRAERRDNVRGAFAARSFAAVADRTVLLVDDVLTMGETASEAARVLRPLKPKSILVAVVAHG